MSYLGVPPFGQTVRTVTTQTANGSANTFYPTGGYIVGYLDVFYNGVRVVEAQDYTAGDGNSVTFSAAPTANAVIEMVSYGPISFVDSLARSGDTLGGTFHVRDLIPVANNTYSLGNNEYRFANLYLSGNTITIGDSTISANATSISFANSTGGTADVVLPNTGVTADTYGHSTGIPVVTVDSTGRISNVTIANTQPHHDTAYSNAVSVANTTSFNQAANAYANAVTDATNLAANAYANAVSDATNLAANAYANAISVANTTSFNQAANAYANAVSDATNLAANAYANVFNGGTFSGNVVFTSDVTANTVRLNGNMQIDGDLVVTGNTVTMNVSSLAVEDNMIYLNSASNTANPDIGIAGNYNDGTYRHTGIFRDATDGVWKFFHQYEPEPDASAYIDTANNTFALANVQANYFIGTLSGDASTVGGNTASTLRSYSDTVAGTAYSNATSYAATVAGTAYSNAVSSAASTYVPLTGATMSGDLYIQKNFPKLVLDSSSSGDDRNEQGASISIGESGFGGTATLHLTYTGDGYGHIGMGSLTSSNSYPSLRAMSFYYTDRIVRFDDYTTAAGSHRAPIFYDSVNTGYYVDPNSDSYLSNIYINGWFRNSNATEGMYNQTSGNHWYSTNDGYWNVTSGGRTYGGIRMRSSHEGTVNGYSAYWDANGSGILGSGGSWSVNINPSTDHYITIGGYLGNNPYNSVDGRRLMFGGGDTNATGHYYIGTTFNDVGGNYTKLDLAWHTGIRIGSQPSYGGNRFFTDENFSSLVFQVNGGSNYLYKYTWMWTSGTTGMYGDTNSFHIHANDLSSYGSVAIRGSRNSWRGIHFYDGGYSPHVMFDGSGNGGFYHESGGRWPFYYYYPSNCAGIGGSSTASGYVIRPNGNQYTDGYIYASAYYYTSDERKKENITTIPNALEKILQLRGVNFNWRENAKVVAGRRSGGLIAQEVLPIIPEAIFEDSTDEDIEGALGLDTTPIIGYLVEAIKELKKEIDELKGAK